MIVLDFVSAIKIFIQIITCSHLMLMMQLRFAGVQVDHKNSIKGQLVACTSLRLSMLLQTSALAVIEDA